MKEERSKKKEENPKIENKEVKKEKEESTENDEERNGIIPDGMDFKKFLGCGG